MVLFHKWHSDRFSLGLHHHYKHRNQKYVGREDTFLYRKACCFGTTEERHDMLEVAATSADNKNIQLPHVSETLYPSHISDRCEADHQRFGSNYWERISKMVEVITVRQEGIFHSCRFQEQMENRRLLRGGVGHWRNLLLQPHPSNANHSQTPLCCLHP